MQSIFEKKEKKKNYIRVQDYIRGHFFSLALLYSLRRSKNDKIYLMNDYVYSFIHQLRALRGIYIKRNNIMILTNNE